MSSKGQTSAQTKTPIKYSNLHTTTTTTKQFWELRSFCALLESFGFVHLRASCCLQISCMNPFLPSHHHVTKSIINKKTKTPHLSSPPQRNKQRKTLRLYFTSSSCHKSHQLPAPSKKQNSPQKKTTKKNF